VPRVVGPKTLERIKRLIASGYAADLRDAIADRHDLTEAELAKLQSLFRHGKNHLLAAGRRVCDATENLVVFGRLPRFLDGGRRRPQSAWRADEAELAAVRLGLEVLVACYGRAAGRLGRMDLHRSPSLTQAAE